MKDMHSKPTNRTELSILMNKKPCVATMYIYIYIYIYSYTAVDSRAPPLLTHRRKCGRLSPVVRVSWQEVRDAVAVRDFVSSLSEHVSPEQPSGAQLVSCLLDSSALNCSQWRVPGV